VMADDVSEHAGDDDKRDDAYRQCDPRSRPARHHDGSYPQLLTRARPEAGRSSLGSSCDSLARTCCI
jgi:hypothetical protein